MVSLTRQPDCCSNGVIQSVLASSVPSGTRPGGTTTRMKLGLAELVTLVAAALADGVGGPDRVPVQAASTTMSPAATSATTGQGARLAHRARGSRTLLLTER